MENLLKKLQEEAGLSEDQSVKSLKVIKEYMDQEGIDIDWSKFFKGKFDDVKDQSQSFFKSFMNKAHEYSDKIGDKVEDIASQAKDKAHDLSQKASNFLDKDKKEEVEDKVEDLADKAKDKAQDLTDQAKDKTEDLKDKASDYLDKDKKEDI